MTSFRKQLLTTAIATIFCLSLASAAPRLGGYYEHTFQVDYTEDTSETLLDASKLRLDFSSGGDEGELEFRGNVNFIHFHSAIDRDIRPYLPESIASQLPLTTFTLQQNRIYLDNAFLSWTGEHLRFRAGKQQLSWGSGYSINPTDLFHKKDPIDPTYEKEGVAALRLDYRWGIGSDISLIMAPDQTLESSGYAVRAGTHIPAIGYDVALTLHHVTDSTSVHPQTFRPRTQERNAAGFEFSGDLFGLGFRAEGNYNWMENKDDFLRLVSGLDYTFENGLYVMGEVLVNTRAESESPYPMHDWAANLFYGEPVGSGWVLVGVQKDITMLTSGACYVFAEPGGSFMVNPRLTVSVAQNADATIFAAITGGDKEGAFPPGLVSGFARISVFF